MQGQELFHMFTWIRRARTRSSAAKAGRHACPSLEALEERTVPTTIVDFNIPTAPSLPLNITSSCTGMRAACPYSLRPCSTACPLRRRSSCSWARRSIWMRSG